MSDVFADTPAVKDLDDTAQAFDPIDATQGFGRSFFAQSQASYADTMEGGISIMDPAISDSLSAMQDYGVDTSKVLLTDQGIMSPVNYSAAVAGLSPEAQSQSELDFFKLNENVIKKLQQQHPKDLRLKTYNQILAAAAQQYDAIDDKARVNSNAQNIPGYIGGIAGSMFGFLEDPTNAAMTVLSALVPERLIVEGLIAKIASGATADVLKMAFKSPIGTVIKGTAGFGGMLAAEAPTNYALDKLYRNPDITVPDFVRQQAEEAAIGGLSAGVLHTAGLAFAKGMSPIYHAYIANGGAKGLATTIVDGLSELDDVDSVASQTPPYAENPVQHIQAMNKALTDLYNGIEPDLSNIYRYIPPFGESRNIAEIFDAARESSIQPNKLQTTRDTPLNDNDINVTVPDQMVGAAKDYLAANNNEMKIPVEYRDEEGNIQMKTVNAKEELDEIETQEIAQEALLKCTRGGG